MRHLILIACIAIGLVAVSRWLPWSAEIPAASERVIQLKQAQRTALASTLAQVGAADTQTITLPDTWPLGSTAQYRYQFELSLNVPPNRLWALYLPNVGYNAKLWINNKAVDIKTLSHWYHRQGIRSLYFVVPNGIIHSGPNVLQLDVDAATAYNGYLGPAFLGPHSVLAPYHDRRTQQHRLFGYTALALALLALAATLLAQAHHADPTYRWLRFSCAAWALCLGARLLTESPIPWMWIDVLAHISQLAAMGCAYVFVLHYMAANHKTVDRRMITGITLAVAVAALLIVLATLAQGNLAVSGQPGAAILMSSIADIVLIICGCLVGYRLLRYWQSQTHHWPLTALLIWLGTMLLTLMVWDTYSQWQHTQPALPATLQFAPILFFALSYLLFSRFATALQLAEAQTLALRSQLDDTAPMAQVVVQERERIMRDMHDGVGGHLVSSLAILRNRNIADPDLEELLNQALTDLRLMIDSLEDTDGDLSAAIAMLKQRTSKALSAAGIRSRWRIDEINLPSCGPTDTLQIQRILQETLANIAKHAKANHITVTARMVESAAAQPQALFEVIDDGVGFDTAAVANGRGLLNMQQRAQRIGATLTIDSSPQGTRIQLRVGHRAEDPA